MAGDGGVFLVVDDASPFLAPSSKRRLGVAPLDERRVAPDAWEFRTDVLYAGVLFRSMFRVTEQGIVTVVDDRPKREVAPEYRVAVDGFRRFCVSGH